MAIDGCDELRPLRNVLNWALHLDLIGNFVFWNSSLSVILNMQDNLTDIVTYKTDKIDCANIGIFIYFTMFWTLFIITIFYINNYIGIIYQKVQLKTPKPMTNQNFKNIVFFDPFLTR